jgi:hypothetical protein
MDLNILIAYLATSISIIGRLIFMYLLYSKKSTNLYSLIFSIINIVSSSLWITYSQMILDMPLLVRGSSDLLFIIEYIVRITQMILYKNRTSNVFIKTI